MASSLVHDQERKAAALAPALKYRSGVRQVRTGFMQRIAKAMFWYRRAVLAPETPEEKAEWQKTSF